MLLTAMPRHCTGCYGCSTNRAQHCLDNTTRDPVRRQWGRGWGLEGWCTGRIPVSWGYTGLGLKSQAYHVPGFLGEGSLAAAIRHGDGLLCCQHLHHQLPRLQHLHYLLLVLSMLLPPCTPHLLSASVSKVEDHIPRWHGNVCCTCLQYTLQGHVGWSAVRGRLQGCAKPHCLILFCLRPGNVQAIICVQLQVSS